MTYKGHIDKEGLMTAFKTTFNTKETIVAWESGHEETPYEHTHLYVDFGRAYNTRDCRRFDVDGVHPNIKPITARKHLENIWRYLCKEDHENDYLLERIGKSMADRVWQHNTLQDALRNIEQLRDVVPTIQLYNARPTPSAMVDTPEEWRPWQAKIIEMIAHEPDDRSIVWIHDKKGGCGKSRLTRWLYAEQKAIFVKYFGRTADFMTLIENALSTGWDGRCLIADLPRDAETKNIYEPIESLKDGMVQTTKYIGKTRLIASPHVIVMANFRPDMAKLTHDRWRIYSISDDFDLL